MSIEPAATPSVAEPVAIADFLRDEPTPLPGTSKPDLTGHIKRDLPEVLTSAERWAKRGEKIHVDQETGEAAAKSLMAYNAEVLARHAKVMAFFNEQMTAAPDEATQAILAKIDPTRASDYQTFIRETLAGLNARFVVMGAFSKPTVTGDALTAATPADLISGSSTTVSRPDPGLTPLLATMNSAHFALENGADLVGNTEEA